MKTRALAPSFVILPDIAPPYPSIPDFLAQRFPKIPRRDWHARIASNSVFDSNMRPITFDTPYVPSAKIFYYRESEGEPAIPFAEKVVYQNEHILVADKPHYSEVSLKDRDKKRSLYVCRR